MPEISMAMFDVDEREPGFLSAHRGVYESFDDLFDLRVCKDRRVRPDAYLLVEQRMMIEDARFR